MSTGSKHSPASFPPDAQPAWIVMQPANSGLRVWLNRLLVAALCVSLAFNVGMYSAWKDYYARSDPPHERYLSGDRTASAKIAVIKFHGTIMPPFTERWMKAIERAAEDKSVVGVLLDIDSPGGLVADSDQLYHKLRDLNAKKKVAVSMKRIAASGGYYIAMGAGLEGRLFAEETTWTGSIGVIIPHYDATELSKKFGVASDPLKTGPFKDALSPFREMTADEQTLWKAIIDDAFERFQQRIFENRKGMTKEKLEPLAKGQIFTADQALKNGLIDEIGNQDAALEWLRKELQLTEARVVTYEQPAGLIDLVLGGVQSPPPRSEIETLLDLSVPRAMYFCSWLPGVGVSSTETR